MASKSINKLIVDNRRWTTDEGQRVISIAHLELCSGELKMSSKSMGMWGQGRGWLVSTIDIFTDWGSKHSVDGVLISTHNLCFRKVL